MQLIRCLHNLRLEHQECVATIGNFDGVHRGHQAVFAKLIAEAREKQVPATVITFEPQPLEYFAPDKAPARLTRLREKLKAIEDAGIDQVLLLEFGPQLAEMSAEDFVTKILIDGLGVKHLYVGDDFRFGKGRSGDVALLRTMGDKAGFTVDFLPTVALEGERISSTRIRSALSQGDLATANECLGRSYRICGRISHGDKRGRTIGFPTANINLHRRVSPLQGVYAVKVFGIDDQPLFGVANIGTRPTVEGDPRYLLEVHLFEFSREIYGSHVEVEFVKRIREEKKFDSFEQLRHQIEHDAYEAKHLLGLAG